MYSRTTATALVASFMLALPSCTMTTVMQGSIPQFEDVSVGVEDPTPNTPAHYRDQLAVGDPWVRIEPQSRRRRVDAPRPERRFSAFGMLSVAGGDYEFRETELGKDESTANMVRLRAAGADEDGLGGGIDVKVFMTGNDFYDNTASVVNLNHSDFFVYLLTHASSGEVRIPVRIGTYLSAMGAEFEALSAAETEYSSVGIRVEIEPEVVVIEDDEFEASIFSQLSAGIHLTTIDDEFTGGEFESEGHTLGFEVGIRLVLDPVSVSASYIFHETTIRQSSTEFDIVIPRLETEFTGVQVSMGVKF